MRLPTRKDGVENRDKVYCSEWIILSGEFSRIGPSHLVLSYLVRLDALVLQG